MSYALHKLADLPEEKLGNGLIFRKFVNGEKLTFAHFTAKKGAQAAIHSHENEQVTYVLKGAIKINIDGKEVILWTDDVLVIPSNAPHSATVLEDIILIEVFSPVRQDWLPKSA